ncbi:pimeloyl-ACP methyl ester carboxylesterase [Scopulibacillus darangshiensis]|uniref:Pimeloyl-ACP methyl ester carboxylesterase n=1 Tax=Scopulibacillus darangshiensis TaxID=442528 RepID=A0A4R2P743_9BACL|nr:alpha/beta hydrolase [Scopulibacillus darangshiensis]TCP30597.1 pimeloyl-ACP methyl ester carboxylesterase [Scopulibacillus darangshiensis]
MESKGSFKKINDVEIYYEHHGCPLKEQRPVLVMVHGYLSSAFSFRTLIPYLSDSFTIFALDLPGFGQSEKSVKFFYSLDNYARLVIGFLDAMALKKAVLVGHSMGGQISLYAANQAPDRIVQVVGLSASGYLGRLRLWLRWASYLPFMSYYLQYFFRKKDIMQTFLEVVHNRDLVTNEMVEGYLAPLKNIDFYRSLVRLMRHREGDLTPLVLHTIRQPVLLLWGIEDRVVPVSVARRFKRDLPEVTLRTFENTGHLLPEEKPEEVATEIKSFINQDVSG